MSPGGPPPPLRFAVTVLADGPLDAHAISDALAGTGAAVDGMRELSPGAPTVVELIAVVDGPAGRPRDIARHLRGAVGPAAPGADVVAQLDHPDRGRPGLVVFDMDSTLIQLETVDELARRHGIGEQVAEVTRRAMRGELDFEASLRHRVALLAGLDAAVLAEVAGNLPIMPGAREVVRALGRLGCRTAVVSGGFTFAAGVLARQRGPDDACANVLEIVEGRVTGGLIDPIVTPTGKADHLERIAAEHGIPRARTVAVGDGANDLPMMERAGLGIAFHGKPVVAAAADGALSRGGLERLLYGFGLDAATVARLC